MSAPRPGQAVLVYRRGPSGLLGPYHGLLTGVHEHGAVDVHVLEEHGQRDEIAVPWVQSTEDAPDVAQWFCTPVDEPAPDSEEADDGDSFEMT